MKKMKWIAALAIGMIAAACSDQNPPSGTSGTSATDSTATATVVENDSVVRIVYNGSEVTISAPGIFNGEGYYPATATGGSSVSLSTYTGGAGGPGGGGGRPGGGGRWW